MVKSEGFCGIITKSYYDLKFAGTYSDLGDAYLDGAENICQGHLCNSNVILMRKVTYWAKVISITVSVITSFVMGILFKIFGILNTFR